MWDFKTTDFALYHPTLLNIDWDTVVNSAGNVHKMCEIFTRLSTLYDVSADVPNKY